MRLASRISAKVVVILLIAASLPTAILAAPPDKGLGINLHGVRYWSPTLPFVDVFKQAGGWIPQRAGSDVWNTGERLDLDPDGWVRSLSPGQQAATVVMSGGRYPAGRYRLSYDGRGEVFLGLDARIVSANGNQLEVEVKPSASVILKVMKTDPSDPLRNIRMTLPGIDLSKYESPFNPAYLDYLRGYRVIRFMDWANANLNDDVRWANRTRLAHASQDRKTGVAVEYMIELAKAMDANPWFTVPYAADDDYARQMAKLIKARMPAGQKFYIEYSNEVWNSQFPQFAHAAREAVRLGQRDGDDYYVRRSLEIFRIFEDVFGGSARFVRVLSGQAVNAWRSKRLLDYPEIAKHVDAYAIAPYFGSQAHIPAKGGPDSSDAATDVLMSGLDKSVNAARGAIRASLELTRKAGVQLIAYEAGQHVTNPPGNDDFCVAINRHPQMNALYRKYLEMWMQETEGALMVMFADMSTYGRSGCWGLSEHYGQDVSTTPKLRAVRDYMRNGKVRGRITDQAASKPL